MEDKSLIKRDTFILKIKNKFFEIIRKIFKKTKVEETNQHQEKKKIDKEKIMSLYKNIKNGSVEMNSLSEEELKMLIKLADEEINILKYKIENEITETKITERTIEYYKQKIEEIKE